MDLTNQTEDNQEFVQNLHLLQMKDQNVNNQIELNCSLILTKSLELLIINKNLPSIKAFDKCIKNVDHFREFLSDSEISVNNTLLQRADNGNQTLLVKFLLESNPHSEVEIKTKYLHFACQEGDVNFVKNLIRRDANLDINATDTQGLSLLHLAIESGHTKVAESLIANNANTEAKDKEHLAS